MSNSTVNTTAYTSLASILQKAATSTDQTVKAQAKQASADILHLSVKPQDQGLQSKVSTDLASLAEAEGLSTSDINNIATQASNLSPNDLEQLGQFAAMTGVLLNPSAQLQPGTQVPTDKPTSTGGN